MPLTLAHWLRTVLLLLACYGASLAHAQVNVRYWVDSSGQTSFAAVQNLPGEQLQHYDPQQQPPFAQHAIVWLRFDMRNETTHDQRWVFEFRNLRIAELQVFEPGADAPRERFGLRHPTQLQPLPHRFYAVGQHLGPHSDMALWIRVAHTTRTDLSLWVWTQEDFARYQLDDQSIQFAYFGLGLGILVFNALLGIALRDRLYALYIGFVVFIVLNVAATSGLGRIYLWPDALWWLRFGNLICGLAATVFLSAFLVRLMNLRTDAPAMARLMDLNQALQFAGLLTLLVVGEPAYRWVLLLPIASVVLALVVTLTTVWLRLPGSHFVLLAFGALIMGTVWNILWSFGLLPDSVMARYGVQIGSAAEMLLLSLSLADRFVRLHRAKLAAESEARRAHEDALQAERRRVEALLESERQLESRVADRTTELQTALSTLKSTQEDLVQAEKLSALGAMVAGVSHELNTPLGVIVTASSTLSEMTASLEADFSTGQLTRSRAQAALHEVRDGSELIHRSAEKAAELVRSFKQVAVDQVSERKRSFDLRQVVDENLVALRASLKCEPWPVTNGVPDGLDCDSFPGPLGQILTNLVMNAIHHGLSDRPLGQIEIGARSEGSMLVLWVRDNGRGMDERTLARVFEPFFTTRLGKGGSGLGLSVSHRIATTLLQGDLRAESEPGQGSTFTLRFARHSTLAG
ncbi:7TM diverse intracellular signaling domain-containing protein [Curvibacter sp. APW13]|uniref:sensor histidine kinase n=1 Tax=Curvibacter sp. APW13 TaxID=3077236 RepID=UPI0028DDBAD7|nr:7TM diverse intracellular signaling domain-containing protein [Curvibacter sp. APW13]MDT8991295.1 7TM diverse intracellular signaling domain-containing protein [Curvibacter sp. APW13]